jgi:ankyrin repeat protein
MSLPPRPITAATEALFFAIRSADAAGIDRALANGADINGEETYDFPIDRDWYTGSRTPLRLAVDRRSIALVRKLLGVPGLKVDHGDCFAGETALMGAAKKGDGEIVDLLLAAGADPNREEKYELCTAAGFAIRASAADIAIRLIEAGTDLNRYGHRLFSEAKNFRLTSVSDVISARGLPPKPEMTAKERENLALVARMAAANYADYEPPPEIKDADLFRASEEGNAKKLRDAVAHGMRINRRREGGDTPLMAATRAGQSQAAMILIEGGADLRLMNDSGEDALALAEALGHTHIAAALRRRLRDPAQR